MSMASRFLRYGRQAAFALQFGCFAHFVNEYVAGISNCSGPSMLPTLNNDGDVIAIEKVTTRIMQSNESSSVAPKGIGLGDIVISVSPLDPHKHVCKRVLGLPGDSVCIDPTKDPTRFVTVPRGHVWLQGDNMEIQPTLDNMDQYHWPCCVDGSLHGYGPIHAGSLMDYKSLITT
ncbi:peptidase S24/S26A/S26B/S26C, partial [Syncephalis fuscata]